jgi:peptide/nickel transport system substrate-binding protein
MNVSFLSKSAMRSAGAGALLLVLLAPAALAQEFKLAMSSPPTSLDPHFYNANSNSMVARHIFESLVTKDPDMRVVPGLAESWTLVNNLTWEFKLRKGAKFHDGSEMTAEDVAWSLDRPATIVGSPSKFDVYTRAIINKKIVDPYTIRFTTREPYPLLPADLTSVLIVSKKASAGVASEDYASGKGMIGTGPFKFVKFLRDDRLELERNEAYWGPKPAWSKVTLRFIPNGATRVAALLSGDVEAIENVPTPDLPRIRADASITVFSKVSQRLIYLSLDQVRDNSPFVTDRDGKPFARNPLKDLRVRQAMSMAINREAIRERVMEGLAEPTANLVAPILPGFNPALKVVKYDPEGAKKLLAQAGYPNGFGLTLHTPNNRYINDEKITQTIAQMFARVGIASKVEASPNAVFSVHAAKHEYSIFLFGMGATTGDSSFTLRAVLACENSERGYGTFNFSRYCNPKMDDVIVKAMATVDNAARANLLQEAAALSLNDVAIIPLHQQVTTWATRKGIGYTGRIDEQTLAHAFTKL